MIIACRLRNTQPDNVLYPQHQIAVKKCTGRDKTLYMSPLTSFCSAHPQIGAIHFQIQGKWLDTSVATVFRNEIASYSQQSALNAK